MPPLLTVLTVPSQLISGLSLGCGDWPHTHSSHGDWPVIQCLQEVLKHDSLNHTTFPPHPLCPPLPIHTDWFFSSSSARCIHSCLMHTQAQLFVYAGIFSNSAGEGYTAGGKHWVLRWRVRVLSLLFVYSIFLLRPGHIWLMEGISRVFSFNSSNTRVSVPDLDEAD